ncbi:MAG: hypothetical protein MJZ84_00495 [Paludibacteraceae bacterium]|nr:hypothetical protein [Paludibacteraceae bacterium]
MKKIALLFVLFLSSMSLSVKADIYTDGLKKIVSEGMSAYNLDDMVSALRNAGVSEETISLEDIIDATVDVMANYYRECFTDEMFEQYMTFYSQPEIAALTKKNVQFTQLFQGKLNTFLVSTMTSLQAGQLPSDVKAVRCSKGYKAAFEKYWEFSNMDLAVSAISSILEQSFKNENAQTNAVGQMVIAYFEKNVPVVTRNALLDVMNEEELKLFLSVTEQPFYESLSKVNNTFTEKLNEFTELLQEKLLLKIYSNIQKSE